MNKNFSLYLDVVRFGAAIGVVFSHFVIARWTGGAFPDVVVNIFQQVGVDLVMVFFVLSGFVIAYTVDVKDRLWRDYAFSRATRMYSVAIPAIVLAFLLDRGGAALNPEAYQGWWYAEHSLVSLLLRGASFTNEFWIAPFRVGSNGPFWSLGYEIWYYVLFGFAVFSKGLIRLGAFALVLLLAGPGIALLGAVWLMGVALYQVVKQGWLEKLKGRLAVIGAGFAMVAPVILYGAMHALDVNYFIHGLSTDVLGLMGLTEAAGRAQLFLWHWLVGVLVVVHFIGVAVLLKNIPLLAPKSLSNPIRWLAGASFSIYVVHYPVMQAMDAVLVGDAANPYRMAFLAGSTLIVCFLFADIFERPLPRFRGWLRTLSDPLRSSRVVIRPGE